MRILFITNVSMERCGVRTFGDEMINALRRAGDDVTVWDGHYSAVVVHGYLPLTETPDLQTFDLVHFNWDPQAINHYLPEHFAPVVRLGIPISLFLHDVPPNSTCPVYDVARWRFGFEPYKDVDVIPEPIPPTPTGLDPVPTGRVRIGVSGIRDDAGMYRVAELCERRDWELSAPHWKTGGRWLSTPDEIRRLARNTLNVCWYQTSGRGKSMAAAFCCAARRPLICSSSSMFDAYWPYEDEIYFPGPQASWDTELEPMVDEALIPDRICHELGWDHLIQRVRMRWRGIR